MTSDYCDEQHRHSYIAESSIGQNCSKVTSINFKKKKKLGWNKYKGILLSAVF